MNKWELSQGKDSNTHVTDHEEHQLCLIDGRSDQNVGE